MKKNSKKQFAVFGGIMLLLSLWVCFGLLTPPSPRDQVLAVIDNCIRQSWNGEHAAKELIQGPIDPYPYLKEIIQGNRTVLKEGYGTFFMKAPKRIQKMLDRPITTQERVDFTRQVLSRSCQFDKNIDRVLVLADERDSRITPLVEEGLWRRLPAAADKWSYEGLLTVLDNPAKNVRDYAFSAFQMAGTKGHQYDLKLDKFLYHTNESIALNTAVTIYCIGGDTNRTIPILEKLMDSQSEAVRFWSAAHLLFVSRNHPKPANVFIELTRSTRSESIQWQSFNYLPYTGKHAIPHLAKLKTYVAANQNRLDDVARVTVIRIERQNESDVSGPLDFIRHIPLPFATPILP